MSRLLALIVLLIAYGSFYPWKFTAAPGGITSTIRFLLEGGGGLSLRDIFFNILFYIPVGMVAFLTFRPRLPSWAASLASVLLGATLSIFVEVVQGFEVQRRTSIHDVYANTAGSMLGVAVASIFSAISFLLHRPGARTSNVGALALIVAWIGYLFCPFVPVMTAHAIEGKLADARAFLLVPFVSAAVAWFVAGNAIRASRVRKARLLCAVSVLLIPLQLFMLRRNPTLADLAGAIAGAALFAFVRDRRTAISAAAWATVGLLVFRGIWPIEIAREPQAFSWVPFIGLLSINWYLATEVLAIKLFLYGAAIWSLRESGMKLRTAAVLTASALLAIEVLQVWLNRTPGITDSLLALMIGIGLDAFDSDSIRTSNLSETSA